jgi:hypothetical protein
MGMPKKSYRNPMEIQRNPIGIPQKSHRKIIQRNPMRIPIIIP